MQEHNFLPGKIHKCQICNSTKLIEVLNLGAQPLANSLVKDVSIASKAYSWYNPNC